MADATSWHSQRMHLHRSVHAWPQCGAQSLVASEKGGGCAQGTRICGTKTYGLRKQSVPNNFSLSLVEVALQCNMM